MAAMEGSHELSMKAPMLELGVRGPSSLLREKKRVEGRLRENLL